MVRTRLSRRRPATDKVEQAATGPRGQAGCYVATCFRWMSTGDQRVGLYFRCSLNDLIPTVMYEFLGRIAVFTVRLSYVCIRLLKPPARCDPFAEPRNTTEQSKVSSERFTIFFMGSHTLACVWKLRSADYYTSFSS